jgi:hypothetical protein
MARLGVQSLKKLRILKEFFFFFFKLCLDGLENLRQFF